LFFTPTCRYCQQQFPYWKKVLQEAQAKHLEVLGVVDAREDKARLASYLQQMGCDEKSQFPLKVLLVASEVRQQYKLQSTPNTILLNSNGIVEKQWLGLWQSNEVASAASSLEINLIVH
jgi:thioredoxin-related protein